MIARPTDATIDHAAALIQDGHCVAFPTETVYGLGADATNALAAARIFSIKDRPHFDPLIVHLDDPKRVVDFAASVDPLATRLMDAFWPGPLTLVFPKRACIPDIVTAGLPTVALRVPDHPIALQLIRRADRPIAAPSANPFGYVSPTRAEHVARQLGDRVPVVIDGGPCRVGLESTIVSFTGRQPMLLRHGYITREQIERLIGPVGEAESSSDVQAPGQTPRHYSPSVPVTIVDSAESVASQVRQNATLLSVLPVNDIAGFAKVVVLSPSGDLEVAAAALFAVLRDLDDGSTDHIFAIATEAKGIGRAIMDRLRRAAHR